MENFISVLTNSLFAIGVALLALIAQKIVAWIKKEGLLTELENKRAYVEIVVKATEQMYKEADGPAKLAKAKTQLVDYFNRKKIPFTEAELDTLIESAVKNLKDGIAAGIKEDGE